MRALEDYWLGVQKERDDSLARIKELEAAAQAVCDVRQQQEVGSVDRDLSMAIFRLHNLLNTQEEG